MGIHVAEPLALLQRREDCQSLFKYVRRSATTWSQRETSQLELEIPRAPSLDGALAAAPPTTHGFDSFMPIEPGAVGMKPCRTYSRCPGSSARSVMYGSDGAA